MTKEIQKDNNILLDVPSNRFIDNKFEALDKRYLLNKNNDISTISYKAAKNFTKRIILELKEHEKTIIFPKILIAGKESFDIYWKTEKFKVLINIHENRNDIIHMYGKDLTHPNNPIDTKVNFELSIVYIINWLLKIL